MELQLRALANAGIEHRLFERRSDEAGRAQAATAMLRGGAEPADVADAVRELGADVVHAHNMQPLIGPRGLAAARSAGARVILHLHNARLFCAIGVAARDGGPCFRCRGRNTLPGLALNCRGSLPEAAVYAAGLAAHQPLVFESVARFATPSRWAAGQLALLGVPRERLDVLPHYLPAAELASGSARARGPLRAGGDPARAGEGARHGDRGRRTVERAAAHRGRRSGGDRAGRPGPGARRAGRDARPRAPRRDARPAGGRRDARAELALPRVLALLGARGDGRRACPWWPPGAAVSRS